MRRNTNKDSGAWHTERMGLPNVTESGSSRNCNNISRYGSQKKTTHEEGAYILQCVEFYVTKDIGHRE